MEFDNKTVRELRLIARSRKLIGYHTLSKKKLIKFLQTGVRPLKSVNYKYRTIVGYRGEPFDSFDISKHDIHLYKLRINGYIIRGVNLDGRYNSTYKRLLLTPIIYSDILYGWHISNDIDFDLFGIWYVSMCNRTAMKSLYHSAADVINSNKISMKKLKSTLPSIVIRDLLTYKALLQ